jgi:hypothetical protein
MQPTRTSCQGIVQTRKVKKGKAPIKGRTAETEASDADVSSSEEGPDDLTSFLKRSKALKTDTKLTILKMARDAEKGQEVNLETEEKDF